MPADSGRDVPAAPPVQPAHPLLNHPPYPVAGTENGDRPHSQSGAAGAIPAGARRLRVGDDEAPLDELDGPAAVSAQERSTAADTPLATRR
jgi:hypothetical protein